MKLTFETLEIEHFRSVRAKQTLTLNQGPGLWFLKGENRVEPHLGSNGCLVGGTLIDCPRDLSKYPRGIPIEDLVGKQFLTYSWDFEKDTLTLSKVNRVWCTGVKPIVRVTVTAYPGGRNSVGIRGKKGQNVQGKFLPPCELVGTADHLVMLSDGTWKPLGKLHPGDSLKSLYRRDVDRGKLSWTDSVVRERWVAGWHGVVDTPYRYYGLSKTIREQQFVCSKVNGPRPKGAHAHHIDHNMWNHAPTNLEWKDGKKHAADHLAEANRAGTRGWRVTGNHPRGMSGKSHTPETKARISKTLKKLSTEGVRVPSKRKKRTEAENHCVASVEPAGRAKVFDMEVPATENFVANGIFVHNSGKSTVFNALCWALYGRTAQGLKNPDIKPWAGKGVPCVRVVLQVDGVTHTVARTAKTNGLLIDGKDAAPGDAEKLVGLSFEVFTNTLYLAQGLPLFFDRTPSEKFALFTEVLRLERWEARAAAASARVKELSALETEMSGELGGLTIALSKNAELLKVTQENSAAWEVEQAEKAKTAGAEIKKLEAELQIKRKTLDDADLALDEAWVRVRQMREDVTKLREQQEPARQAWAKAEAAYTLKEQTAAKLERELSGLSDAQTCPTCGQPVTKKDVAKHRKELQRELEDTKVQIQAEGAALARQEEVLDKAGAVVRQLTSKLSIAEADTETLQREFNTLGPYVQQLKARLVSLQDFWNTAATAQNPHREQVSALQKHKRELTTLIAALEDDVTKAQKQIERTRFWVQGFKEVALYLMDELLGELEAVTNATLGEVGLVGWEVNYALERETKSGKVSRGINVVVIPPAEYIAARAGKATPIRWESWSGGEEQRLRIVGAAALSDVLLRHAGIEANLEVFDEPTKYLSGAGVADLCSYLKQRAQSQGKTIWMIDHAAKEGGVFTGSVTVQKTEEGSVVVA